MSADFSPNPKKWLLIGVAGLAVSLIGFFVDTQIAAWSYLIGLIFITSIAIGMLFLVISMQFYVIDTLNYFIPTLYYVELCFL